MSINLMNLPASEAERLAYSEGFTGTAELFGRVAALEHAAQVLLNQLNEHYRYGGAPLGEDIENAMADLENLLP